MNGQLLSDEVSARRYVEQIADQVAMERLEVLIAELLAENQRQNLISHPSEAQVWQRHIADSAQLLRFVPRETSDESLQGLIPVPAPPSAPWATGRWSPLWKRVRIVSGALAMARRRVPK